MNLGLCVLVVVLGYLIGSFPTAYLIARSKGINIFEIGSGNMGATNIARTLGTRYAALTGAIDVAKGVVSALVGYLLLSENPALGGIVGALAAVVGHSWSIFILLLTGELKGGKSAAIAAGTWIVLGPAYITAAAFTLFLVLVWRVRMVSLGVLATLAFGGAWILLWVVLGVLPPVMAVYAVALLIIITYRHRSNIERLLQGTERRIGQTES